LLKTNFDLLTLLFLQLEHVFNEKYFFIVIHKTLLLTRQ
jgi:hypothetical protein